MSIEGHTTIKKYIMHNLHNAIKKWVVPFWNIPLPFSRHRENGKRSNAMP
jgi:hypothetical protein